jgi:hypothetical protein
MPSAVVARFIADRTRAGALLENDPMDALAWSQIRADRMGEQTRGNKHAAQCIQGTKKEKLWLLPPTPTQCFSALVQPRGALCSR